MKKKYDIKKLAEKMNKNNQHKLLWEEDMSWNYRIVERKHNSEKWYEVVEAYYEEDNKTVNGFTDTRENPVRHMGETVEELIEVYEMVLKDLKKSKDDILSENMFDDE